MGNRGPGGPRGRGGRDRDGGRRRGRRKVCTFCVDGIDHVDYKNIPLLRRYTSDRAKIVPRRSTGTCARHQRGLTKAIKQAREIALLPFSVEE